MSAIFKWMPTLKVLALLAVWTIPASAVFSAASQSADNASIGKNGVAAAAIGIDDSKGAAVSMQPSVYTPPKASGGISSLYKQSADSGATVVLPFGHWLFGGNFSGITLPRFNRDYLINIGDILTVRLWGAVDFDSEVKVDLQGNIFIPKVGPIPVSNIKNDDLNEVISSQVKKVYRDNVKTYASLNASQPIKVYVSGYVRSPGLFEGVAGDSIIQFLDRSGGIDSSRGSYINVELLRNGEKITQINLYNFLLNGFLPTLQLHDGDTILVGPVQSTVTFVGLVRNAFRFEFSSPEISLVDALKLAGVQPQATHVRVSHMQGVSPAVDYLSISESGALQLSDGDEVEMVQDLSLKQILVFVEGEHEGPSQFVMPRGATMADLIERIGVTDQSLPDYAQLLRRSVARHQKQLLSQSLQSLEAQVLSARSATIDEADLRLKEAELILQFIERAKLVEPLGQVIVDVPDARKKIVLEDGDRILIPKRTELIAVNGEVYFPQVMVYRKNWSYPDYIEMAGGFTQQSDSSRLLVIHQNGALENCTGGLFGCPDLVPGDELLVLPAVDTKRFQFGKELVQVMYQIAVAAAVVLRF